MWFQSLGSKRHSLQAVELSQWFQAAVQIVSNLPDLPDLPVFLACRPCGPAGWLALLITKAGDVEANPGPTTLNKKVWICDICHKQIHVRKQISITGLNTGCTSDVQVSAKHNTQIPGPAIYTENPDSHLTQT